MVKSQAGDLENYFSVGKIHRAHGIRGDVSVEVWTNRTDRFEVGNRLWSLKDGKPYPLVIQAVRKSTRGLIIKFEGIATRDDAEKLAGTEIAVSMEDRGAPESGTHYVSDLIGCRVISDDGRELGCIVEVIPQEHHDLYLVNGQHGEILIPVVQEFIQEIDIHQRCVIVRKVEAFWNGGNDH
jgi:16S rRNA processing protein RimM